MKVFGWILAILSYIALGACVIMGYITRDMLKFVLTGLAFFVILGFVSHIIMRSRRGERGGCTVAYVITFPAFAVPFVVLLALFVVFKFVDTVLWGVTNRHLLSEWLAFIWKCISGKGTTKHQSDEGDEDKPVFYVMQNGFKRTLTFYEMRTDYAYKGNPTYYRYRDDIGNFWRSYDNNQHFISEKALKAKGHKDIELQ